MRMNFSCNVSSQGRGTQQQEEDKQSRNTLLCVVVEKECDLTVRELNLCFGCFCPVTVF